MRCNPLWREIWFCFANEHPRNARAIYLIVTPSEMITIMVNNAASKAAPFVNCLHSAVSTMSYATKWPITKTVSFYTDFRENETSFGQVQFALG